MIFRIENFGPIKVFEMDLSKDMHLLYGKNSVGKSYAVGVLYLFLKHFGEFGSKKMKANLVQDLKINFEDEPIDITDYIENQMTTFLLNDGFINTIFNTIKNNFAVDNLSQENLIKYNQENFTIQFKYFQNEKSFKFSLNKPLIIRKNHTGLYCELLFFGDSMIYSFSKEDFEQDKNEISKRILNFLFEKITNIIQNIYFLPASRSGLYPLWSSMGSIFAWVAKYRFGMTETIKIPPLSESISDYFLNISASKDGEYKSFAESIENKVLDGKVILDKNSSKIFFKSNHLSEQIELPYSGSMVSEISPLVTYLKDIMTIKKQNIINMVAEDEADYGNQKVNNLPKNILIIEEPEAHLHPEAQVELMKIFADMVQNSNIKLILTSHSDYMFAELGNLILGKKIDYRKVAAYHLVMEEGGSVDAKDMEVTDEGILDYNFVDVSEKLYNERMELFEQLNEEVDAH
jgi:predicted ATPase